MSDIPASRADSRFAPVVDIAGLIYPVGTLIPTEMTTATSSLSVAAAGAFAHGDADRHAPDARGTSER